MRSKKAGRELPHCNVLLPTESTKTNRLAAGGWCGIVSIHWPYFTLRLGHSGHPPHLLVYLSSHTQNGLTLCSPFISPRNTLLKYYLPASFKRLLLLLLLLLRGDATQDFHTFLYRVNEKIIHYEQ